MSLHFKGLIEVGLLDAALYGAEPELQQSEAIGKAVEVFLRAMGHKARATSDQMESFDRIKLLAKTKS